jgi:hypothetical protein
MHHKETSMYSLAYLLFLYDYSTITEYIYNKNLWFQFQMINMPFHHVWRLLCEYSFAEFGSRKKLIFVVPSCYSYTGSNISGLPAILNIHIIIQRGKVHILKKHTHKSPSTTLLSR